MLLLQEESSTNKMAAIGPRCLITLILTLLGKLSVTPVSPNNINLLEDQKWQIKSCVSDHQPTVTSRMLTLLYLDSMQTRCIPTGPKTKQIKHAIDPVLQCLCMMYDPSSVWGLFIKPMAPLLIIVGHVMNILK